MSVSFDKTFAVQGAALKVRAERNQVLAENLANADTPNYKARDFDFKAVLQQQIQPGTPTGALQVTHNRHIQPEATATGGTQMLYRVPYNAALDGNTVETHQEQAKFAENAVNYQASLQFLGDRIQGLIGALRGE